MATETTATHHESEQANSKLDCAAHWGFLERETDAACVVTRCMEVLFLNSLARTLVPKRWFGCRCWEVFPVGEASCASKCPAVKAVRAGESITYCEETLFAPNGTPLHFAIAVIPLGPQEERAIILLRPKGAGGDGDALRSSLLDRAHALRASLPKGLHRQG